MAALVQQVSQLTVLVQSQQQQIHSQSEQMRMQAQSQPRKSVSEELSKLSKPGDFVPFKTDFAQWDFVFLSYLGNLDPDLRSYAEMAKRAPGVIPEPQDPREKELGMQLHHALSGLCKQSAQKSLRRVSAQNGAEAYRALAQRWGSQDESGGLGLMQKILNFQFGDSMERVEDHLNDFLLLIEEYEAHPDADIMGDSVKKAKLLSLPDPLGTHLKLNCGQLHFAEVLKVIEDYLKAARAGSRGSATSGAREDDPMDVSLIHKKYGKQQQQQQQQRWKNVGKSSGSGSWQQDGQWSASRDGWSQGFEGYCNNPNCGKYGHRWKDCWAPGGGASQAANAIEQEDTNGQSSHPKTASAIELSRFQPPEFVTFEPDQSDWDTRYVLSLDRQLDLSMAQATALEAATATPVPESAIEGGISDDEGPRADASIIVLTDGDANAGGTLDQKPHGDSYRYVI